MSNLMDSLMQPSGKSFKFERVGDRVTGTILTLQERQQTEFGSGAPAVWADGTAKKELVITLQTALGDEADDGVRVVRIKGWGVQLQALKTAAQLFGRRPAVGDTFSAEYIGEDNQGGGAFAAKVYVYVIAPPRGPVASALSQDTPF